MPARLALFIGGLLAVAAATGCGRPATPVDSPAVAPGVRTPPSALPVPKPSEPEPETIFPGSQPSDTEGLYTPETVIDLRMRLNGDEFAGDAIGGNSGCERDGPPEKATAAPTPARELRL